MKKLYIQRHAQKDMSDISVDDYDIPLTQKGIDDATSMAYNLSQEIPKIDLIVSSPARRTKTTAEIFASKLEYRKNIMYNEVLYMSFVNELLETISYTFDTVNNLLLIGHNPSLTALTITLSDDFREKIAMGGLVCIEFDCDSWTQISKDNARLIYYKKPEEENS